MTKKVAAALQLTAEDRSRLFGLEGADFEQELLRLLQTPPGT